MAPGKDTDRTLLVWERPEPVARAGAPALTASAIAEAAMAIADREGLHALSVKRVASKLGTAAPKLESYLPSRDDLLDLILDAAFGEIAIGERDPDVDWRTDLTELARATQAAALAHPWLRTLAGTRIPCGPNGMRNSERALASMDGIELDVAAKTTAVNTVLAYVYGYVQLEMAHTARRGDDDEADLARRGHTASYLLDIVGGGEYPRLASVFQNATFTTADAFDVGLTLVLNGIAALVEGAPASSETATDAPHTGTGAPTDPATDMPTDSTPKHRRARKR